MNDHVIIVNDIDELEERHEHDLLLKVHDFSYGVDVSINTARDWLYNIGLIGHDPFPLAVVATHDEVMAVGRVMGVDVDRE